MLYFGNGVSSQQAMKTYTAGPKPGGGGGRGSGGRTTKAGTGTGGHASGRDSSGYLRTGGGGSDTSIMAGTYSALTYGGSTQYNFSGTQSYGAGT